MAGDKSTVRVTFLGDATALANAAKKAQASTDAVGKSAKSSSGMLSGLGKSVLGAVAAFGAVSMFKGFIQDAEESRKIGRLTEQVIKSTGGAAKITAEQVGDLATAISNKTGADDEAIQSGANLLLTFTNVQNVVGKGNDIFNQATQTITDMSVALGQDTKSSAIQLGKALNDPIKGVTALSRVGVSFTAQQRKQIETLVKSGKTLAAQKIILKELGREFGGAAEAAASPSQKLGVIVGNLKEQIGGALLPAVDRFATFLATTLIPAATVLTDRLQKRLGPVIQDLITGFVGLVDVLKSVYEWYTRNKTLVESVAVAILAVVAAVKVYRTVVAIATAVQTAWNIAMMANPLGLIVLAIIGLAAALVYAWKRSDTFRAVVLGAFHAVGAAAQAVFGWIGRNWPYLLGILIGPFGLAVAWIFKHWDSIVASVKSLRGRIGSASSGMWDGIKDAFRSMMNWIIGKWNGLEFKLPSVDTHIPNIGKIGGFTLGTPDIPQLANGGIVRARRGGTLVNVGEGGQDEAVVPLGRGRGSRGGDIIFQAGAFVVQGSVISERDLVRTVRDGLADIIRNRGGDPAVIGA